VPNRSRSGAGAITKPFAHVPARIDAEHGKAPVVAEVKNPLRFPFPLNDLKAGGIPIPTFLNVGQIHLGGTTCHEGRRVKPYALNGNGDSRVLAEIGGKDLSQLLRGILGLQ
jgi:hypothetical protein